MHCRLLGFWLMAIICMTEKKWDLAWWYSCWGWELIFFIFLWSYSTFLIDLASTGFSNIDCILFQNVIPTNKPNVEPKRPGRPVDISSLCRLSPTVSNAITVSWAADFTRVGVSLQLHVYICVCISYIFYHFSPSHYHYTIKLHPNIMAIRWILLLYADLVPLILMQ